MRKINVTLLLLIILVCLYAEEKKIVSVFYKERKPSQVVLARVDSVLAEYKNEYDIRYLDIEDEVNANAIKDLNLPQTHFPFAVVIIGKYTAEIKGDIVHFVHFPFFMHGIGRHEGDWSLSDLKLVLSDNTLLRQENVLPVLEEGETETDCEGE